MEGGYALADTALTHHPGLTSTADTYAADEFEMLTLSCYQEGGITEEGMRSGRLYRS